MFREEKKKLEEQSKPKVATILPGWGCWAGPNIKKRTFKKRINMGGMFRTPAKPPRKDFNREKVIIHENADVAIKSHLVRLINYIFLYFMTQISQKNNIYNTNKYIL